MKPPVLLRLRKQVFLLLLAVLVGALAAAGEIAFRLALAGTQWLSFGHASDFLAGWARHLPWWHVLLAPCLGGLVVGVFLHYTLGGRPQGVAHVMEAATFGLKRLSFRAGIAAAVANAASLGCGASSGREGPIVHLGATLAAAVARRTSLGASGLRVLMGCGAAGAVAAGFNAPIAGVFFALEVVVGHYALSAFTPIVVASVTATGISRFYHGANPAFILPVDFAITSPLEYPAFLLLGVVSAVVAQAMVRGIMAMEDLADRSPVPRVLRPALAGLAVGLIATQFPEVLGVGYEATDQAIRGAYDVPLLVALLVAKTAAVAITLGWGFGGGVFSPSLFLGAMAGGAFGIVATAALPELSSGAGVYTLVGMGAVAAPVLGAPISTILIVFEMTGDYDLTTAVMIGVVVATTLHQQTLGRSFFEWQLERRQVHLRAGDPLATLAHWRAQEVVRTDIVWLRADQTVSEATVRMLEGGQTLALVTRPDGRLLGMVSALALARADLAPADDGAEATIAALADNQVPTVTLATPLGEVITTLERPGTAAVAVIEDSAGRQPVGLITQAEITRAYREALTRARGEDTD